MGRTIKIQLSETQRRELEKGFRFGHTHAFRTRCHMVLLKNEGRKSSDIAAFFGFCQQAVNNWLKRYLAEGIDGLVVREGRGRPAILSVEEDFETVKQAVSRHRQRISQARAELEATLGKEFSTRTLQRYLKILTADIKEFHAA